MRKTFLIIFTTSILMLSAMIFDYIINSKETKVSVYNIKPTAIQESFYIEGKIQNTKKFNYIEGNIIEPFNIKEGAQASVYIDGVYYEGYLQSLNKNTDSSLYTAKVSIVSDKKLNGNAEAYVYGKLNENVILVPPSCILTDSKGKKSIMIATDNYCVRRNVLPVKINNSDKILIKEGLFPEEKIILNPQGLKSGEKISYK